MVSPPVLDQRLVPESDSEIELDSQLEFVSVAEPVFAQVSALA